jgi:NhaA family Na+:H+ antiporter
MRLSFIQRFLSHSASGGLILMGAAALALIVANSGASTAYEDVLHAEIAGMSVLHWINDGLMAFFFLLVGLEIKRELVEGELSTWRRRILPGFAAAGGMAVPAVLFLVFNAGLDGHPNGWAIPSATDIAFALGVLSLLGRRVPVSLRIFLTALAILDDLGAVAIIAVFYTSDLDLLMLGAAAAVLAAMVALNVLRVGNLWFYAILGVGLWYLVLQSGIHATLAGVALALVIPIRGKSEGQLQRSPLHRLEHGIQPWVTFLIVPIFGFANAGVSFAGITTEDLLSPVPVGIAVGLFVGKQVGVFLFAALAIRLRWAEMPTAASWRQLYGVAVLCGIGFTMSLFIGLLAFEGNELLQEEVKFGIISGSVLAAALGTLPKPT